MAVKFYKRILWLISHQLQIVRTKFLKLRFNHEHLAIQSLISQNGTRLSLFSDLHKIPSLLNDKSTQGLAFDILHRLHSEGDSQERHIASLCLDNLQEVEKELEFYNGLIKTYNTVIQSQKDKHPSYIRKACAKSFNEALIYTNTRIEGWENLPNTSGNSFI
jgi:hypothetical protein